MFNLFKKRFWVWPSELKERGVLGINARNLFLLRVNPRKFYPQVDDKVLTKDICKSQGIPVPETYAVIKCLGDIKHFHELVANRQEFVVKPSRGSGGRGIIVVIKHSDQEFETSGGETILFQYIRYRIASILAGAYSLGGLPDKVIIEQRIKPHSIFEKLAVGGTPDIRVILYKSKPVMGMLRLPTVESRGRANLHQGAVGVGVDLSTGITRTGVLRGRMVTIHPDTSVSLQNREIPHWQDIISIATRLSQGIGLSYIGVDIVLDMELGPVVLEANARPGLAIQTANSLGLREALNIIPEENLI